jgi:type VI secretion system protein ImpJ
MADAIVWREGLFLRPQHFQQNDRRLEYEFCTRTIESSPNNWGLYELDVDLNFLKSGKFALNRVYGIMPDGTLIDISTKSHGLVIDIEQADAGKSLYLALPVNLEYEDAVCFEEELKKSTRFVAKRENEVPNINVGEKSETELLVAKKNFQILKEEELNEGYQVIKIAKIGNVGESNAVSLETDFMPTFLHMDKATYLQAALQELQKVLHYRIEKISEKLSDASVQAAELGDYLLLQLIHRFYNRLGFFLSLSKVHPQTVFLELTSLIAELAVFMTKEKKLNKQFIYEHEFQKKSFEGLMDELKVMLSAVLEQHSVKLPIEKRKYGIYVAKIEDKSLIQNSGFVLAVTANIDADKLKKLLSANLKIGTIETIRDLVNYHLAGFKLKPLPVAPRQIPYRVNHIYFKLALTTTDKEKLQNSGGMAFHLSGEIDGIEYTLWAVRSANE